MMIFQFVFDDMTNAEASDSEGLAALGIVQDGVSPDYSARVAVNPMAAVPRPMLWNKPTFKGFAGPMYGKSYATGEECLRYEQWTAYEALSA